MSFSSTIDPSIIFPDTPQARRVAQMLTAQAERRATTQRALFSSPAGHATRASAQLFNFSSPTSTTNDIIDGSTAEPTVRSEITIPPIFSPTNCVLRSVNPLFIYDTTTNLSTTTNYFKLDMHEHQQLSATTNYFPFSNLPTIIRSSHPQI